SKAKMCCIWSVLMLVGLAVENSDFMVVIGCGSGRRCRALIFLTTVRLLSTSMGRAFDSQHHLRVPNRGRTCRRNSKLSSRVLGPESRLHTGSSIMTTDRQPWQCGLQP